MNRIKRILRKSIPLGLVLLLLLNTTLAAAVVQHYFYKKQLGELTARLEEFGIVNGETPEEQSERLYSEVISDDGVVLPITWGDLGKQLVDSGVINQEEFMEIVKQGPLSSQNNNYEKILAGNYNKKIVITAENSRFVLNTLWALGLAQQSTVLTEAAQDYPEIENLAGTGGWTLARGEPMNYYNAYSFVDLNEEEQALVKEIASNIYRPCCNNHTAFPDCNHGMAMLGLVELMVNEGVSEEQIYDYALDVNSIWFSDAYVNIARYKELKDNTAWNDVDSKEILGSKFSSVSGYQQVMSAIEPAEGSGGSSCSV